MLQKAWLSSSLATTRTSYNISTDHDHDHEDEAQPEISEEKLDETTSGFISFTHAQHKALSILLHQSSASHSVNHLVTQPKPNSSIIYITPVQDIAESFIIDTGTIDHVCFSRRLFSYLKRIPSVIIKLPNSSLGTTNFARTIHFDDNFVLTNVIYMSRFTFNLIYVPKPTLHLECQLIFDTSTFFIETSYSKKMIGVAELRGGLYILNHPHVAVPSTTPCINSLLSKHNSSFPINYVFPRHDSDCNIWDWRLGHPSNAKLIEIKKTFPFYHYYTF